MIRRRWFPQKNLKKVTNCYSKKSDKGYQSLAGTLKDPIFYEILSFGGPFYIEAGYARGKFSTLKMGFKPAFFFRWMFWVENQRFWLCGSYLTVHLCHPPLPKTLPSYLGFQTPNPREEVWLDPSKKNTNCPKDGNLSISRFLEDYRAYLEDHPRTWKWLITMIDKSPNLGYFSSKWPELHGLYHKKHTWPYLESRCYFLKGVGCLFFMAYKWGWS